MTMQKISNCADELVVLSDKFDYPLMNYFAASLKKFMPDLDMNKGAHRTIVEAHIDVMWAVLNENLHGQGGERARKLKELVAKAIRKYS